MKKINWGIIGLGNVAQNFLEGFSNAENANLLAISSKNIEKLKKFKNFFKIDKKYIFDDYENLIKCKDIDIVYISLPNSLHYEWIIKCIENKKKILVEKPATINFDEAKDVIEKTKANEIFLTEGFMYRYHPQMNQVIKIIRDGEIGDLVSMKSYFGKNLLTKKKFLFFNSKKRIKIDNRLFNKKLGGGCILDLGCYTTSFSLLIAALSKNGDYKKFKLTNVNKTIGETGVDVDSEGLILFENGFSSEIKASFKKNLGSKSIIKGKRGSIIINNTWHGGDKIIKIINDKKDESAFIINKSIYSYEIEKVSKSILDGSNEALFPGMKLEETLTNMKIIDKWLDAEK
jgi:predicted dehydrogenase